MKSLFQSHWVLIVELTIDEMSGGLDLLHSPALRAAAWAGLSHNTVDRLGSRVEFTSVSVVQHPDPCWVVFLRRQRCSGPAVACVPPPAFGSLS